jgi:general nucleoside transport system ATP-binding protein
VTAPALALSGITRRFGALVALDDASFAVRAGTVHALLGENGAGKTTLMRIAFGMMRPDIGQVRVDGRETPLESPADAIAAGIGMVHQHFTLVPPMTVAENVALGGHGLLHRAESAARVREVAAHTGFALDPDTPVERLSVGAQQRVEIAKALARRARVLILDEPTAVLAPAEAEELLRWVREYAAQGNSAVLITHKLREALAVADDVTVLRQGRVVHAGRAADASERSLTTSMLGASSEIAIDTKPGSTASGAVVFRVEHLVVRDERGTVRVHDAAFTVRAGEIVGFVGVEGAGHRELLRALAGRLEPESGVLVRPREVGFIPEDRHHDAVLLDRSLTENVALRGAGTRRGSIDWAAIRARTMALMQAFDVRAPDADASMRVLSGGNQQKLVLARELEEIDRAPGQPAAIVAENPTRGLDVRATADVHARLRAARDRGAAIILYSSDLQEVLSLASRVLVAYAGSIREVAPDRDAAGRAMLGIHG